MLLPTLLAATLLQAPVTYHVRFPNAVHHEAQITATFPDVGKGAVTIWMSRSSPGRYALHEFAKNVYAVSATDGAGRAIPMHRRDPYSWTATTDDGTVTVHYTLFGDRAGGTYTGIDSTHAHLQMPATFMWAQGLDARPIRVTFEPPVESKWKVATQLLPTKDPWTFTAPNLQYFMDSPTELSDFQLRTWTVSANGHTYTMRLAVHSLDTPAAVDSFADMAKRIVAQEEAVYGTFPRYLPGTYTFIADYLPWVSGDGMEHRNSTSISSTGSIAHDALRLLGTLAHEYFHSWNMERIRAEEIEPFDFTRANASPELWFGEGFTNYYGKLALRRAGFYTDAQYARTTGGALNYVLTAPGRTFRSVAQMSMLAPFVDAATSIDPTNFGNTYISYYPWGEIIALGLDLTLREQYPGKTLDGFMRLMWQRHGAPPERSYTMQSLQRDLGDYVGNQAFAADFFRRYVTGHEVMDYAKLLEPAGFIFRRADSTAAFLGFVQLDYDSTGATIRSQTLIGSPLYAAGLDDGDRIETIAGHPLTAPAEWTALEAAHHPGDSVEVTFVQRGMTEHKTLVFVADPRVELVPAEDAGMTLTDAQRAFRAAWLGSHVH
ncbi:MAG TPA: hypothetical protein VJ992_00010 [Gemmatimonadales bacterium]|nr:hypothetical protein [Gemmatimonadales bacterium]